MVSTLSKTKFLAMPESFGSGKRSITRLIPTCFRTLSICLEKFLPLIPSKKDSSLLWKTCWEQMAIPFVLCPRAAEILIDDQIRNLKKFHHIYNVSHLKLTTDNDFSKFEMRNSLMYLTPTTFQNRHLLVKCQYINSGHNLIMNEQSRILQEIKVAFPSTP